MRKLVTSRIVSIDVWSRHRWLSVSHFFYDYTNDFTYKNFKRVFLKTTFFELVDTILEKLFDRLGWNFQGLFSTRVVIAWTTINILHPFLTPFFYRFRGEKGVKKFKPPPFCHFFFKFIFRGSWHSHWHIF